MLFIQSWRQDLAEVICRCLWLFVCICTQTYAGTGIWTPVRPGFLLKHKAEQYIHLKEKAYGKGQRGEEHSVWTETSACQAQHSWKEIKENQEASLVEDLTAFLRVSQQMTLDSYPSWGESKPSGTSGTHRPRRVKMTSLKIWGVKSCKSSYRKWRSLTRFANWAHFLSLCLCGPHGSCLLLTSYYSPPFRIHCATLLICQKEGQKSSWWLPAFNPIHSTQWRTAFPTQVQQSLSESRE